MESFSAAKASHGDNRQTACAEDTDKASAFDFAIAVSDRLGQVCIWGGIWCLVSNSI
jgi:hypothetical protein